MPFDQPKLHCPDQVGCMYFGLTDETYLLVLDEPIAEEDNAIAVYAEEALDIVSGEVQDQEEARALARLTTFKCRAEQLSLAASIVEKRVDFEQIDFYTDPEGFVWVDAHGDDTDSSQYIVRFAPNMNAVRDLWFKYSLSSLAHSDELTMHRLLFDGGWRYEHCCKRTQQTAADRIELLELELWHSFASGFNTAVVNLADICSGSHPVTGAGPKGHASAYSKHNLIPESSGDEDEHRF